MPRKPNPAHSWINPHHMRLGKYLSRKKGVIVMEEPECLRHQRRTEEILRLQEELKNLVPGAQKNQNGSQ